MTALRRLMAQVRGMADASAASAGIFVRDVGQGLLEVSHNTLALLGLVAVGAVVFVGGRSDLRESIEAQTLDWLQARQEARADPAELLAAQLAEPDAVARATAVNPKELNRQQAAVAQWISRRYRVAPEPISRLVKEAWIVGNRVGLDPTLILAIMAVESSFNPFAQSPVGAQGLMQVMTHIHDDKYTAFGGKFAAFDPVTNLRVGAQVLKECITRAGSLEEGLRYYVGAANLTDDGGYATKVLAEQNHLRMVAGGKIVAVNAPRPAAGASSAKPESTQPAQIPVKGEDKPLPERVALLRGPGN
ncbi:lytic transglycosylase domain-containing protein [Piscinibacter sp. XHJ-5]|uniref:lytic transglycosylase domain-containing protein n=1 Tax=Piscinibacter sp. XHJ-5 TaxID=3037797 RepID=UPI00245326C8|nr:lytic transglycosylase domain-containing protein [Piscinibacter sp. XHJ-5]